MRTKNTALQVALRLLARREHSALQLQQKLAVRGFSSEEIQHTLEALTQKNYLSNQRFAHSYVESRIAKGYGPVRIAIELRERGIDERLAQAALAECQVEWSTHLQAVYEKRFGSSLPTDFVDKAKKQQFLLYRGFTHEQINALFK